MRFKPYFTIAAFALALLAYFLEAANTHPDLRGVEGFGLWTIFAGFVIDLIVNAWLRGR